MSDTSRRKFLAAAGVGVAAGTVAATTGTRRWASEARRRPDAAQETRRRLRQGPPVHGAAAHGRRARGRRARPRPRHPHPQRGGRPVTCRPTAKHPRSRKDPVADSTDVYAFVSPNRPDTVTLIANFIPLQPPDGGPNFYEFGDDVLYEIHISNRGKAERGHHLPVPVPHHDPQRRRRSSTTPGRSPSISDTDLEPAAVLLGHADQGRQVEGARPATCACPPVNVGPRSTPNYATLAGAGRAHGRHAARSSPASAPTPSTSTSAASSTSARCGRSTTCT